MPSNLQQLGAYSNQPQSNPEDQYLPQLGAQQPSELLQYDPNAFVEPIQQAPSETSIGDLQGRYNYSQSQANNPNETGIGALAHGIASIFLGHKLAKANAAADANRKRLEDIELQSKINKAETDKITLQEAKQKLLDQEALQHLTKINMGDFSDPESIKKAKVIMNENGTPLTYGQRYESGYIPKSGQLSFAQLKMYNPYIADFGKQAVSPYSDAQWKDALGAAMKAKKEQDDNLAQVRAAAISKGSPTQNDAKAYVSVLGSMSRNNNVIANPDSEPDAIEEAKLMNLQASKFANQLGIKLGFVDDSNMLNGHQINKHLEDFASGKDHGLDFIQGMMNNMTDLQQKGTQYANTPPDAAAKVKSKEAPIPVGTNAAPAKTTPPPKVDVFDVH